MSSKWGSDSAQTLLQIVGERSRAIAEADKAAGCYREAGDTKAKKLAEVEAWLQKHRP